MNFSKLISHILFCVGTGRSIFDNSYLNIFSVHEELNMYRLVRQLWSSREFAGNLREPTAEDFRILWWYIHTTIFFQKKLSVKYGNRSAKVLPRRTNPYKIWRWKFSWSFLQIIVKHKWVMGSRWVPGYSIIDKPAVFYLFMYHV